MAFTIKPVGDCAVLVVFEQRIAPEIGEQVSMLNARITAAKIQGVIETVPAFASLMICFDPITTDHDAIAEAIRKIASEKLMQTQKESGNLVEIPVCYGGAYGPDLEFVAKHAGMTPQEVISLHSAREYRIYMLGFLPGFPYLGGLDERLFTPRLASPRTVIPAGSVGIGGEQTGIYPIASPGGWQLIGRTPLKLYNPAEGSRLPYKAGDRIRFVPVTDREYQLLSKGEDSV